MFCPNCGTFNPDDIQLCNTCQHALRVVSADAGEIVYARFLDRLAAWLVDTLLLMFPTVLMLAVANNLINDAARGAGPAAVLLLVPAFLLILVLWVLYFTLMEAGVTGATLGKRLMKIRVVDLAGQRISKQRALGRYLAHALSNLSFIGYIIQPFTGKKQAMHDMVAGTLVVQTENGAHRRSIVILSVSGLLLVAGAAAFYWFIILPSIGTADEGC